MPSQSTSYLQRDNYKLAYAHTPSLKDTHSCDRGQCNVIFCGGFKSSMQGLKALALETFCTTHNIEFTRFDYSGHGESDGKFTDGNIEIWLEDALSIFDEITSKPGTGTIVIGSSMGAWIATLLAEQRKNKITGLITIAAAPDFTEKLLLKTLNDEQRSQLESGMTINLPSDYDDGSPYPISPQLISKSRSQCVLHRPIDITTPVRMLHGTADKDVPYQLSIDLMNAIQSKDITLNLIKDADHRLSDVSHLDTLNNTLLSLLET